ncbi:MAG: AAA family ATPase, partial [Isosphaeraceae bacterium]
MSLSAPSVLPPLLGLENSNGRPAFHPRMVNTFEEAGLSHAMVESLILKFLLNLGTASGRRISAELGLPFGPFPEFLRQLKNQQIVNYTSTGAASDFIYSLTDTGRARAKIY